MTAFLMLSAVLLQGAESPQAVARRIVSVVREAQAENAGRPGRADPADPKNRKDPVVPPARPGEQKGKRNESTPEKLLGDALADHLVRKAAGAARRELDRGLEPLTCAKAFLIALGVSLDPSGILENHPFLRLAFGQMKTPEQEGRNREKIGGPRPTLAGRTDSLQHFVVTSALTAVAGGPVAWAASLEKETQDSLARDRGEGSGFSFADLAAAQGGISLAELILRSGKDPAQLNRVLLALSRGFRGRDHVLDLRRFEKDPDEQLGWTRFQARFGSLVDSRFVDRINALRRETRGLPAFR